MKKYFILFIFIMSLLLSPQLPNGQGARVSAEEPKGKLAIVIDDFGEDRRGVEEMLSLPCKLNIAVMPGMEYSIEDANKAHEMGHEVILHMPMENESLMPASYYGPVMIKNGYSAQEIESTMIKAIESVPHAVGMNNHMGTGVSKNKRVMKEVLEQAKKYNLYFLDSKTIEGSVCGEVANEVGVRCYERNFFLEPPGQPNYERAKTELLLAGEYALANGSAIAIGHVGPVGDAETARAIKDTLETLKTKGVELVFLSEL